MTTVRMLTHNHVQLALHELRPGSGRALLLLHGLGEASPAVLPEWATDWPGSVHALDFTGHGRSTVPAGGGYSAELLLADADAALAELADAAGVTVVGRGLGAYVALLLAGARSPLVHGTVLCDGPGLAGGAVSPTSQSFFLLPRSERAPDQYALWELSKDLRPPDYATTFVRLALEGSPLEEPIAVAAIVRPPWLAAVAAEVGVVSCSLDEALRIFAAG